MRRNGARGPRPQRTATPEHPRFLGLAKPPQAVLVPWGGCWEPRLRQAAAEGPRSLRTRPLGRGRLLPGAGRAVHVPPAEPAPPRARWRRTSQLLHERLRERGAPCGRPRRTSRGPPRRGWGARTQSARARGQATRGRRRAEGFRGARVSRPKPDSESGC